MARKKHDAERFVDLPPRERRREAAIAIVRTSVAVAAILGIYALLPLFGKDGLDTADLWWRVVLLLVLFGLALWIRFRRIQDARLPEVRAIEGAITALFIFLALVAYLHLSISRTWPDAYSQPLNSSTAFYFTTTVFATVGFGDIVARTDTARLVVTGQMIADLAVLALVARVLFTAARSRLAGQSVEETIEGDSGPALPGMPGI